VTVVIIVVRSPAAVNCSGRTPSVLPDTEEAKNVLGFEAITTLDEMLDEVIAWIDEVIKNGTI
jgi:nucleoside-diphosphate-sugar epimerase